MTKEQIQERIELNKQMYADYKTHRPALSSYEQWLEQSLAIAKIEHSNMKTKLLDTLGVN